MPRLSTGVLGLDLLGFRIVVADTVNDDVNTMIITIIIVFVIFDIFFIFIPFFIFMFSLILCNISKTSIISILSALIYVNINFVLHLSNFYLLYSEIISLDIFEIHILC